MAGTRKTFEIPQLKLLSLDKQSGAEKSLAARNEANAKRAGEIRSAYAARAPEEKISAQPAGEAAVSAGPRKTAAGSAGERAREVKSNGIMPDFMQAPWEKGRNVGDYQLPRTQPAAGAGFMSAVLPKTTVAGGADKGYNGKNSFDFTADYQPVAEQTQRSAAAPSAGYSASAGAGTPQSATAEYNALTAELGELRTRRDTLSQQAREAGRMASYEGTGAGGIYRSVQTTLEEALAKADADIAEKTRQRDSAALAPLSADADSGGAGYTSYPQTTRATP